MFIHEQINITTVINYYLILMLQLYIVGICYVKPRLLYAVLSRYSSRRRHLHRLSIAN